MSTSRVDDRLQPTPTQLDIAVTEAREYWYSLADEAIALLGDGTALGLASLPQDMLCRVPALPATQLAISEIAYSDSATKAIVTTASSTLRVVDTDKCNIRDTEKVPRAALLMGIQSPISCHLSRTSFRPWRASWKEDQNKPNFTGILALAWAYVLSTRLVEMLQQEGAEIIYTNSSASYHHDDVKVRSMENSPSIEINIGKTDENAARWWAAILAPNQGWKAIFTQRNGDVYLAPWSVSLEKGPAFNVVWQSISSLVTGSAAYSPPSSQTALRFLAEFCFLHDLGKQFLAAFSATLTFPTHKQHEICIELPLPTVGKDEAYLTSNRQSISQYLSFGDDLAYYIALSCNYSVVMSSLCGSFWDPSIPCNLVSPWLHPVLEEIPKASGISESEGQYHEIIAVMCGIRRPRLSSLWIGAALTGLVPTVINLVRNGTPPLDPNGFSWTASPQSFMDLSGSGPYFRDISGKCSIGRIDAWRLLYLPVAEDDGLYYQSLPFSPWWPIGETAESNCALRVRAHKSCPRHRLVYTHWTWQLQNGSSSNDQGFCIGDPHDCQQFSQVRPQQNASYSYPTVPLSPSQDASREASLEIFRWVLANHEGKPPSEPIYDDVWIDGCDYSDESSLHTGTITNSEIAPLGDEAALRGQTDDGHETFLSRESQIMEWVENNL
ncbi:uncharacterized protein N7459_001851 [Penicillium hispanicum]|uniref:uncharacterized protein n=1 Tax=Penicillium hispanicum TaxID=1080232 RepID=UPI002541DFC8|nr:uncharacterized protein N7459_001851 [Penicillium hispanicum]KAJ5591482.1 hypothetical protein N7459_001851 [Penicillium hispanicum]